MKTLRDWLPREAKNDDGAMKRLAPHMDKVVIADYGVGSPLEFVRWPGTHKNVMNWCILESNLAVAWNENPGIGWSFPSMKLTAQKLYRVVVYDDPRPVYLDKTPYTFQNEIPKYVSRTNILTENSTHDFVFHTQASAMEAEKRFPMGVRESTDRVAYVTAKNRFVTMVGPI